MTGSSGTLRSVRFRVEFTTQLSASSGPMATKHYACSMSLTLEKGSATAFKNVCNGLRKSWE